MKTYLVGGAVRDKLLNYPVFERDWVVVDTTVEDMLSRNFRQVGKDFPVFLHPTSKEEYALARTERKTGKGYAGFQCFTGPEVTIEDDLLRRDLTINAIAEDEQGNLIDPYGGQEDIKHRKLRHVSSAFEEDPLRILRVARFYARYHHLGFQIAEETLGLMQKMVGQGMLEELIAERVWIEIKRSLGESSPEKFIQAIHDIGGLGYLFPTLADEFKYNEAVSRLTTTVKNSSAEVVTEQNRPAPISQFSALFIGANVEDIRDWCVHYRAPNEYQDLALMVSQFIDSVAEVPYFDARSLMELIESLDAIRRTKRFEKFLAICTEITNNTSTSLMVRDGTEVLTQAIHLALSISAKNVDKGLIGPEIGQEISRLRCDTITKFLERKNS